MTTSRFSFYGACVCAPLAALLTACGSDAAPPPVAASASVQTLEEVPLSGFVKASSTTGNPIRYTLLAEPKHGTATIDVATGAYTYVPDVDYFGNDAFQFQASDGHLLSAPAIISIQVQNLNDPPVFLGIHSQMNSPETLDSTIVLPVVDADGDTLLVTATSDDTDVARVASDQADRSITISPLKRGITQVRVTVRDSEFERQQVFSFMVGDVTKNRSIDASTTSGDTLTLTNTLPETVTVTLAHNGFPMFQSEEEMAQFVFDMAPEYSGEPFERKLWRFIRDSVYHNVPLNNTRWLYDPWAVISSQGWGFCGHVSAAYVRIARAAGYEARVWGLNGHVVPEIKIDGRWQVYDPDLAVYYLTENHEVAGIADLVSKPDLISAPVAAIFAGTTYEFPYSPVVTEIYASSADNYLGDNNFLTTTPSEYQLLELPPGASFTYPGRWTDLLTGVDGATPHEVPYFLQGNLTIRAGTAGRVLLPWMLWEIRGNGRVRIQGNDYDIGAAELTTLIQSPGKQIPSVEVLESSSDVEFIVFVNAMRYVLRGSNLVQVTGKDVWAVDIRKNEFFAIAESTMPSSESFLKPVAPAINQVASP
jgi:hypothetical protein